MPCRLAWKPYRLPLRTPLRTAHGPWGEREGLLVRLEDGSSRIGYGEIAPITWFGTETMAEATEVCAGLGGLVDESRLASVPERFGCVRFALAAARPGASSPAPQNRLPVAALLPAGRAALQELPGKLESGYLVFKWKVGVGRTEEELGVLDDLLGMLPTYAKLRLDANGAWDRRQAGHWLTRCAERPVEFVEQPLAPADRAGLAGLARDYPVPLALDESVVRLAEARRWQAEGWPGIFVIKPALCGPLAEIGSWIAETRADVVLSSAIETALGRAAILRWALGAGMIKRALGFGVGPVFGDSRWDGPAIGPLVDLAWCDAVNPEELWNALS